MSVKELIFTSFEPYYGERIIIPPKTLLWRGYDTTYEPISDRPTYFSMKHIAMGYAKLPGRALAPFWSKSPLTLLDIRFCGLLCKQFFECITHESRVVKEDEFSILMTTLSLGNCSFQHQMRLFRTLLKRYPSLSTYLKENIHAMEAHAKKHEKELVEQSGVRIAETTIDGFTMTFLRELFGGIVDGIISPQLQTPFHIEKNGKMSPEIILFKPDSCALTLVSMIQAPVTPLYINTLLLQNKYQLMLKDISTNVYIGGGEETSSDDHPLDRFYTNRMNKRLMTFAQKSGCRLRRQFDGFLQRIDAPVPHIPLSIFRDN